jgi:hypothetical protein
MERAIQKIFKSSFHEYQKHKKLPIDHLRAADAFLACRTEALGGHVQSCKNKCETKVQYHSCKHRACPQCNFSANARWLEKQKKRLIHCPHHHVIFTLPHELNLLWQHNKAAMMQLLFTVVKQTLFELLRDEKYLGGEIGVMATFHSWSRSMGIHPHLHCLVTAGGWSSDNTWVTPKKSFLLPGGVVRDLFSGKYLAHLKALLKKDALTLPSEETTQRLLNLCNKLGRKKWNVRIEKRYDHPNGIINYLSRYVRGGPFKNQQILSVNADTVTFRYLDHRTKKNTSSRFSPKSFIASALEHVPPYRKQVIRSWGLYAGRCLATRNKVRDTLGQAPESEKDEYLDWKQCLESAGLKEHGCCPVCSEPLHVIREIPRARARGP